LMPLSSYGKINGKNGASHRKNRSSVFVLRPFAYKI